jgi:hypothetical protein
MPHVYTWVCEVTGPTSYWCKAFSPESFADWVQALVGVFGLAGLVVGFLLTKRTLNEIKRQNATLEHQLAITDRAWLSVKMTLTGPFFGATGASELPLQFVLTNHGKRVATEVRLDAEIVPGELSYLPDAVQVKRQQALIAARAERYESVNDYVVFPEQREVELASVILQHAGVAALATKLPPVEAGTAVFPVVIGCIRYRYEGSPRPHTTRFGFCLYNRTEHGDEMLALEKLAEYRVEDIGVRPYLFMAGAD